MIHIEKNQNISDNPSLKVYSSTGDYEDTALIEFYDINNSEVIAGAFHAQFIKYGGLVYKFSEPKELGEEILKIDPESTHISASYVRMMNELLGKMNEGSLEPESLNQVISDEQINMEEKREEVIEEPITEEVLEEPAQEEPIVEEEVVEEPIIEEPVIDSMPEPLVKEPVIDGTLEVLQGDVVERDSLTVKNSVGVLKNKIKKIIT